MADDYPAMTVSVSVCQTEEGLDVCVCVCVAAVEHQAFMSSLYRLIVS